MNQKTKADTNAYATVWRWHFYAGLFSAPFLIALAITGLGMMLFANIDGRHGEVISINVPEKVQVQTLSSQVASVQKSYPNAMVAQYISPKEDNQVAVFRVVENNKSTMVALNPYTNDVVSSKPKSEGMYDLMDDIHGDLLIGKTGDYILETTASLTILMILTGWYMWWIRQKNMKKALLPELKRQKQGKNVRWWRNAHGATGAWVSVLLFFFLLSGLSWAGIWGAKMVQAWSQFPAGKWGNPPIPISTPYESQTVKTHGDVLNAEGTKEVPWVLEQTPMPTSKANSQNTMDTKSVPLQDGQLTLDNINAFAKAQIVNGRYQLNFPKDETGVWTISQDSMSYDSNSPTADRTIHIDQYSGKVLADIKFADYNLIGKMMAVGIALHMGTLGWWSILANSLFCLAIIFMCVGGLVMWWKRRPSQSRALVPPPKKQNNEQAKLGLGFGALLLVTAIIFPTAIIAVVAIYLLDFILIKRVPALANWAK